LGCRGEEELGKYGNLINEIGTGDSLYRERKRRKEIIVMIPVYFICKNNCLNMLIL
jgi:hypothetical protein